MRRSRRREVLSGGGGGGVHHHPKGKDSTGKKARKGGAVDTRKQKSHRGKPHHQSSTLHGHHLPKTRSHA